MKTLAQLRREKAELLKRAKNRELFKTFIQQKKFEEKKIRAEIKALKNPRSTSAKVTATKIATKTGRLFAKGSILLGRHLAAVAREQNAPTPMKKRSTKRKKRSRR